MEEDLNRLLSFLYSNKENKYRIAQLNDFSNVEHLLDQLAEAGLISKIKRNTRISGEFFFYKISISGIKLFEKAPIKFKDRPYSYYSDYKKEKWEVRHPLRDRFRTGFITFLFSVTALGIGWLCNYQGQRRLDNQQDKSIESLLDSVANLRKRIDTL